MLKKKTVWSERERKTPTRRQPDRKGKTKIVDQSSKSRASLDYKSNKTNKSPSLVSASGPPVSSSPVTTYLNSQNSSENMPNTPPQTPESQRRTARLEDIVELEVRLQDRLKVLLDEFENQLNAETKRLSDENLRTRTEIVDENVRYCDSVTK